MLYPPLVCASLGDIGGSGYYRVLHPLLVGDSTGVLQLRMPTGFYFFNIPTLEIMKPDAILFHRSHTDGQYRYIKEVNDKLDVLKVYTVDDWVEKVPKESPHFNQISPTVGKEIRKAIKLCDRLIVTNDVLANVYGFGKDTRVIPNYLVESIWNMVYATPRYSRSHTKPRIGWSGGIGHPGDLQILKEIANELGDEVTWVFMGMVPDGFDQGNSEVHQPVDPKDYPKALYDLDLDLALAPLLDNDFNKAKSNLRILEYGACGYPVLASDVEPYKNSPVDKLNYVSKWWTTEIRRKLSNLDALKEEGEKLKQWVWTNYKLEDHIDEYSQALSWDGKGFKHTIPVELSEIVDIVVTAYENVSDLKNCIESVLGSKNRSETELIIVDDGSTNSSIKSYLKNLSENKLATVINKPNNEGYISAVNTGISLHQDRDVIILNCDTVVNSDWVDRLRIVAYSTERIASVTPLSNNSTITSYPNPNGSSLDSNEAEEIDELCNTLNLTPQVLFTPVGFATYLKRDALLDLGLFDQHAFGVGYGEENDWSMRACHRRWTHLAAVDTYIWHGGGRTFGTKRVELMKHAEMVMSVRWPSYNDMISQWNQVLPLTGSFAQFDLERIDKSDTPVTLFITHQLGGGVETVLNKILKDIKGPFILGRYDQKYNQLMSLQYVVGKEQKYFNMPYIDTHGPIDNTVKILNKLKINKIWVHSLVGYTATAPVWLSKVLDKSKIPCDITLHDYWFTCPRLNMIDNTNSYCDTESTETCNTCISVNGSHGGFPTIELWREEYGGLLDRADKIIAPSNDVINRFHQFYPKLKIDYIPHEDELPDFKLSVPYKDGEILKVLVLGILIPIKGSDILVECAKYCFENKLPINFILCGAMLPSPSITVPNLVTTGPYREDKLYELLKMVNCNISFFPVTCPETYSFTLSHAFIGQFWPTAFDIGAIAERIRDRNYGTIIPYEKRNDTKFIIDTLWGNRVKAI